MDGLQLSKILVTVSIVASLISLTPQTSASLTDKKGTNAEELSESILVNNEPCLGSLCEPNDPDIKIRWTNPSVEKPNENGESEQWEEHEKQNSNSEVSVVHTTQAEEDLNLETGASPSLTIVGSESDLDKSDALLPDSPDDSDKQFTSNTEDSLEESNEVGDEGPKLQIVGIPQSSKDEMHGDEKEGSAKKDKGSGENDGMTDENDIPVDRRQKYFSLLYTFGTLINSFLSEFSEESENHDESENATIATNRNASVEENIIGSNTTVNGTESGKKNRFQCAFRNITDYVAGQVMIVNSTELLEILNYSKHQKISPCVLVMFYAPWCHFCARTAPQYNALARAFPHLDILAVDTSHFSYLNARFGTVAVPNVMLFHSRSAVRFNQTTRDLEHFVQFVTNYTGIEPKDNITVESQDYEGPLSSTVVQGTDWLLWLSWTFVFICSTYFFVGSHYGQSFITRLRVLWQEHQHIE